MLLGITEFNLTLKVSLTRGGPTQEKLQNLLISRSRRGLSLVCPLIPLPTGSANSIYANVPLTTLSAIP